MNFWRQIPKPIVGLAPMDGVTDVSFRFITAKHGGPDIVFTEFVNIQSAFYSPHTLIKDLAYSEVERPVVAQIYGRAPDLFYKVAHIVCELGFDGLDINMGCPSRKVAASGCGAALIRAPEVAREIIRAARRGVEDWFEGRTLSDAGIEAEVIASIAAANRLRTGFTPRPERRLIPVSVKTRLGYDRNVVDDWIPILLEEKPSVISLHGRTLQQGYKGNADWDAIARAAEIANGSETAILGNGDVQDLADAYKRVRETGVDGVLLGRAAQGNPWVFADKISLKTTLANNCPMDLSPAPVSLKERFRVIIEHCEHYERLSANRNFVAMRKHLTWYCRNFRGAAELRSRMIRVSSAAEVAECLAQFSSGSAVESRAMGVASRYPDWGMRQPASLATLLCD
jgi:nifR3 family TIM-barrel protein